MLETHASFLYCPSHNTFLASFGGHTLKKCPNIFWVRPCICVRYIKRIHLRNKGNVVQKRLLLPYRLLYVCPFSRYPDTTDGFQKHDINETKAVQQGVRASWQLKWMGASWQMLIITVFRNWWSRSPSSRNRGGTEEMHTVPYLYV